MDKKIIFLIILSILFVTGCAQSKPEKTTLSIAGSSSGLLILDPIIKDFSSKHPDYRVTVLPGTDTKDGLMGVSRGLLDVSSQARYLTDDEKAQYPNVREVMFIRDALVVAVNSGVNVTTLSKDQLQRIYSGNLTDWSEVGGNPGKIIVLDREESDSSKLMFRQEVLGKDLKIASSAILLHSAGDMNRAIITTPNAIGVASYGVIKTDNLDMKIIAIDGIVPSPDTITDGKYTMVRTFGLTIPAGELEPITQQFVDQVLSAASLESFRQKGYIPISG